MIRRSKRRVVPGGGRQARIGPVKTGILVLLVVAIGCFFAFTKSVPFKHHYEITAVVRTSNLLAKGSPVRIAGVPVGTVVGSGRHGDGQDAEIRLRIDGDGRRTLRRDASLRIRPRLFLEGNFYVDLQPGSPDAPAMPDGGVIPVTRTAVPVQLDQVLAALPADTRGGLRETVHGLGDALGSFPKAADRTGQDPAVAALPGGRALNRTLATSPKALQDSAAVLTALRGRKTGDLSRAIDGLGATTDALGEDQAALRGAVRDFATTVTATGDAGASLRASVAALARTSATGRTAFAALDRAMPATRTAASDLTAAMRETPATIDASLPWLAQARPLLGQAELRGLLDDVRPTLTSSSRLVHTARRWFPRTGALAACANRVLLPTAMVKLDDGALSTDTENYKEFFSSVVGLAGAAQTFDGNGTKLRLQTIGGATRIKSGATNYSRASGGLPQFANLTQPSVGTSPAFSPVLPPVRTDVPCARNGVPALNGPASQGPADGSAPSAPATPVPNLQPVPGSDR
ncbi:MlaD family protein [Patulibacter minatonensis]|uniref:MlaD family protein n=1 Tax=Patulibacter minatonensis TaxID=298163 RepID=UPI00047C8294|nr:MlaD family protein [Patulibacter minatonensis]